MHHQLLFSRFKRCFTLVQSLIIVELANGELMLGRHHFVQLSEVHPVIFIDGRQTAVDALELSLDQLALPILVARLMNQLDLLSFHLIETIDSLKI